MEYMLSLLLKYRKCHSEKIDILYKCVIHMNETNK